LPFRVVDERQGARFAREYQHVVIDTPARPTEEDLRVLAGGCDMLVIPTTPDALALRALKETIAALHKLNAGSFRVLLTIVPPPPSRDGADARAMLQSARLPLFKAEIPRLSAFSKAALQGVAVSEVNDPRAARGWAEYVAVGQEIRPHARQFEKQV
jgi:chromosome partitioning protein